MTPLEFAAVAFAMALFAGLFGSLLGLGGGIVVVPALTLGLGVDIRYAIGASIVAVIATSTGSSLQFLREDLVNVRLAVFLEVATTVGALSGAYLAGVVPARLLYILFGAIAAYVAFLMGRGKPVGARRHEGAGLLARQLSFSGTYRDDDGHEAAYAVDRTSGGVGLSYLAGAVSGLLGVGGGFLKVPAMHLGMGVPLKVATATSNFMIGVTAAASAGVYFLRGDVAPCVAAPVSIGVALGAMVGSRMLHVVPGRGLKLFFVVVLLWIAGTMILKGIRL